MSSPGACGAGQDEAGTESAEESRLMPALGYLVRLRGKMLLFNVLISPECGLYTWHQAFGKVCASQEELRKLFSAGGCAVCS